MKYYLFFDFLIIYALQLVAHLLQRNVTKWGRMSRGSNADENARQKNGTLKLMCDDVWKLSC